MKNYNPLTNFLLMDYDLPQLDQEHLIPLYSSQEVPNQDLISVDNFVLDSLDDINTDLFLYTNDNSINESKVDINSYSQKFNTFDYYEPNLNHNYYNNHYYVYQNQELDKPNFFTSDNESCDFLSNSSSSSTSYNSSLEYNYDKNNSFLNDEKNNYVLNELDSKRLKKKEKKKKLSFEEKERIKLERKHKRLERKKIQNREAAKRYREKKKLEHEKINFDLENINATYSKLKSELKDILLEKNVYLKLIKNLDKLSNQNKSILPKWMS